MKGKNLIEKLTEVKEEWEKTNDIMDVSMNFTIQPCKARILLFSEMEGKRNAYEVDFAPVWSDKDYETMGDWEVRVYVSSGYLTQKDFCLIEAISRLIEEHREELRLAAIGCCPISY